MTPLRKEFLAFGKPDFGDSEVKAIERVLRSGWVGMGPEVIAFEKELAGCIGAPHVVTVNSCTSALFLSLVALNIGPGDEVICPSLTWCSTANAALYLGAIPVFCDVDKGTLCATPESIARMVTARTKAAIIVHMGGYATDMRALRDALPPNVAIIEDAAHAFGAKYPDGKVVGSSANFVCFSFYANKNLSTGEGGAIALFDDAQCERLRSLRQHGLASDAWKRYIAPQTALVSDIREVGYKMNFCDLQAALGRVQLKRQEQFRQHRLGIAQRYVDRLLPSSPGWLFQHNSLHEAHARHLLIAILPVEDLPLTRDQIVLELRERQIGASIHYKPLHHFELYRQYAREPLPVTEFLAQRIVTLPISASMDAEDVDYVVEHLIELQGSTDD